MNSDASTQLDFDLPVEEPAPTCDLCQQPLANEYFTCGESIACSGCAVQAQGDLVKGSSTAGFLRAILVGSGAGLVGAAIWYGVRTLTGYEIGLIAILVGYMVGTAVRSASRGRGGLFFQILAVLLTYFWISANYVPEVYQAFGDPAMFESETGEVFEPASPFYKALAALFLCLTIPFFEPAENAIGLLILAFGLHQAWVLNRRQFIAVEGPFKLNQEPTVQESESHADDPV